MSVKTVFEVRYRRADWRSATPTKTRSFAQRATAEKFVAKLRRGGTLQRGQNKGKILAPLTLLELVEGYTIFQEPKNLLGAAPLAAAYAIEEEPAYDPVVEEVRSLVLQLPPGTDVNTVPEIAENVEKWHICYYILRNEGVVVVDEGTGVCRRAG